MSDPKRLGVSFELKPHAYDPAANPELFDGVPARRVIAFFIDLVIVAIPVVFVAMFILVFGLFTLGLGWMLFWLLWPGTIVWALIYFGSCFGSPRSATIGMRVLDLEMRTWYGAPAYFVLGAVHTIVFWLSMSFTPFVLLVCLFNERRRLLHDMLVGTIVINNEVRASGLRAARLRAAADLAQEGGGEGVGCGGFVGGTSSTDTGSSAISGKSLVPVNASLRAAIAFSRSARIAATFFWISPCSSAAPAPPAVSICWNSVHAARQSLFVRSSIAPEPAAGSETFARFDSSSRINCELRAIRRANESGKPSAAVKGKTPIASAPPKPAAKAAIVVRSMFT